MEIRIFALTKSLVAEVRFCHQALFFMLTRHVSGFRSVSFPCPDYGDNFAINKRIYGTTERDFQPAGRCGYLRRPALKKRSEAAKAKLAEAEARKAEQDNIVGFAEEWKALYEQRDKRVDELNVKIDQLYQDKETDRQRIRELQEKNTQLTLDLQAANFKKCEKKGCGDRQPPTGY